MSFCAYHALVIIAPGFISLKSVGLELVLQLVLRIGLGLGHD